MRKMYGDGRVFAGRGETYFVALILCGVCFLGFGLQQLFGTEWMLLIKSLKLLEPWRLVTSLFAHSNWGHLSSNLFALGLFGSILEGRIGSRRILGLFLASGILINIFSPYERSLGASGAIFALLGCLVVLRPMLVVWVNGLPMPMALAGVIWLVQDIMGIFVPDNVANLAHIGGLFIGAACGWALRGQFADRGKKESREEKRIKKEVGKHIKDWEDRYM